MAHKFFFTSNTCSLMTHIANLLHSVTKLLPLFVQQIKRKQLNSHDVLDLVKQAAQFNSTVSKDRARRVLLSDVHPAVSCRMLFGIC